MTVPKFKKFKIEAYKPGKSNIAKIRNIIKLSANESALGVSPRVKKILQGKQKLVCPNNLALSASKGFEEGIRQSTAVLSTLTRNE